MKVQNENLTLFTDNSSLVNTKHVKQVLGRVRLTLTSEDWV